MNKSITNALMAIGLVTSATLATAQAVNAPAAHPQMQQRRFDDNRAFSLPSERVEARLAYVKTALKITDAQQPQWNAYADTMRKQAAARDKRVKDRRTRMADAQPGQRQRPTAVDRLERRQQFLASASANLSEQLAATKPLYAALTPEQKRVADVVFAGRGGRGGFGGRGGHRHA